MMVNDTIKGSVTPRKQI